MSKPTLNPQTIQNRISHLLKHWPTDAVRPASVSVQTYLQSRLQPTQPQQAQPQQAQPSPKTEISEASLNALSSLLEDRYARRYPLPPKLRRPATNPDHYDNVVKEFEEAPGRDFWGEWGKGFGGCLDLRDKVGVVYDSVCI
ncbi:ubiquinol-cytochrome c reductase complex assembly factor 2 [Aspergillus novofumigatus IBT 16806]|uniref:Uncharacterized protein n=1 Tax=Aspergillus novofumigatus (strain IBT 16806) TaxID=1392255 RepID=A0A2I1C458_ASPN1|nr:uncharacterized protein P174DRAFT_504571 [Aspergillus novofumigatus IBT 16806]PKX92417.1 hypothetical protein P174DRAFT_504571 [Aspergillus novofumigatus IBT 16806]